MSNNKKLSNPVRELSLNGANGLKVIKIGAEWCPGCVVMKPRWAEIEKELPELKTEYFDADEHKELLKKYEVKNLPAFIFLDQNENVIVKKEEEVSKEELLRIIQENKDK